MNVWWLLFQNKLKGLQWLCIFFSQILIIPVLFVQKIRLCSGSPVKSLFGGASPSTWPVWSTSLWLFSTLLAMMEMRVSVSFFFSCNTCSCYLKLLSLQQHFSFSPSVVKNVQCPPLHWITVLKLKPSGSSGCRVFTQLLGLLYCGRQNKTATILTHYRGKMN